MEHLTRGITRASTRPVIRQAMAEFWLRCRGTGQGIGRDDPPIPGWQRIHGGCQLGHQEDFRMDEDFIGLQLPPASWSVIHLDVVNCMFDHMPLPGPYGFGIKSIMMVDAQSGIRDDGMKVRLWPVRVTIRRRASRGLPAGCLTCLPAVGLPGSPGPCWH